jgi:hypothetical protein
VVARDSGTGRIAYPAGEWPRIAAAPGELAMPVARFRRTILAVALAFALPIAHAQSVGSAFTYQGELRASGAAANAAYDFQFRLYSSPSGTTQLGAQVSANAVTVANGLFSVPLDFGPAQFAGDAQWLEISVRPAGSGAFETLSPRTAVTATPYALGAVAALANSVTTTSIVDGSVQFTDVNAAQFQSRVTGTCTGSQGIQSIAANGTVVCGTFGGGGGTITGVTAGAGLTGGGTSGGVTLGIANGGVGTAQINADQVQRRVTGQCAVGQYVRAVAPDGAVTCGTDASGTPGWGLTGNAGTDPLTNFIGTTDAQPFVVRTRNARSLRIEPSSDLFGGVPITTNTIAGSSANTVTLGVRGATISGGGVPTGASDPNFSFGNPNRVTDHYGSVGGGFANRAGDDAGTTSDRALATVSGGSVNTASGLASTVSGGDFNTASGIGSTVGGGGSNCAGGDWSWAGGGGAKVRPGISPGGIGACSGLTYPGGNGDAGTFVWADSQLPDFVSTGSNQFLVRAAGGMAVNTNTPAAGASLTVNGTTSLGGNVNVATNGALSFGSQLRQMINLWGSSGEYGIGVQDFTFYQRSGDDFAWFRGGSHSDGRFNPGSGGSLLMTLTPGASTSTPTGTARAQSFVNVSDRASKAGFAGVDVGAVLDGVLALPMQSWTYRNAPSVRHLGPVAQDFFAAFGLGGDDKTIATVDADGVALAAIQGLNAKLEAERDTLHERVEKLDAENAALRARLEAIEARLGSPR